jgi:hypothetical protein
MSSELPEGNGIAAEYPGDKGIERDTAVVFADGFETTEAGPLPDGYRKQDEKKWDNSWRGLITEQAENVHSGKRALEMTLVRPGPRPAGAGVQKHFKEGFETLFLRYYAKFDKNAELYHGGAHNGGNIDARAPGVPLGCPGVRADGSNKFTAVLDTYRSEEQIPSPGHLVVYCYHMDQGGRWGDQFYPSGRVLPLGGGREPFGEQFVPRSDFVPEQGLWHCYELMVHANTPGKRDGRIAFWVDGTVRGDFPNLRLRNVETLKANHIDLGIYTHNPRVRRNVTIWFDDVVAATSYVGPQVTAK